MRLPRHRSACREFCRFTILRAAADARYGVTMRLSAASAARRCIAQFFQRPRNTLAAPFSREVIRAEALRTI
jgi:hypothetical protein